MYPIMFGVLGSIALEWRGRRKKGDFNIHTTPKR